MQTKKSETKGPFYLTYITPQSHLTPHYTHYNPPAPETVCSICQYENQSARAEQSRMRYKSTVLSIFSSD